MRQNVLAAIRDIASAENNFKSSKFKGFTFGGEPLYMWVIGSHIEGIPDLLLLQLYTEIVRWKQASEKISDSVIFEINKFTKDLLHQAEISNEKIQFCSDTENFVAAQGYKKTKELCSDHAVIIHELLNGKPFVKKTEATGDQFDIINNG